MKVDRIISSLLVMLCMATTAYGQEDIFDSLDDVQEESNNYATAFFKSTRVVNSPSIELTAPGVMNFVVQHRFGTVNNGLYDLFGIDNSEVRLSFDFGITPWLMVGIGRSGLDKTYDLNAKAQVLRQQTGNKNIPVSVAFYGGTYYKTLKSSLPLTAANRTSYLGQVIIARKFSSSLSVQVSPTFVHSNLVSTKDVDNDVLA